jgi:hypothetical protein
MAVAQVHPFVKYPHAVSPFLRAFSRARACVCASRVRRRYKQQRYIADVGHARQFSKSCSVIIAMRALSLACDLII